MKRIEKKTFQEERELYNSRDLEVVNCRFEGPVDGESALKESNNILVSDCYFDLRYPFWHDNGLTLERCDLTNNCRASLWYDDGVLITSSTLGGPKALRECKNVKIEKTSINSIEFGWKCNDVAIKDATLESEYPFFMCKNLEIDNLTMKAKYSYQYDENVLIKNSSFITKDAFWHTKNVTVENSTIKGEYLAWYSEGLTLINCVIEGTQPFCYCKNLKLINCKLINCDLAFEYSSVDATIIGTVDSIKNPIEGKIVCDDAKIILEDSKYKNNCEIVLRNK